jgi:hypothetical protein
VSATPSAWEVGCGEVGTSGDVGHAEAAPVGPVEGWRVDQPAYFALVSGSLVSGGVRSFFRCPSVLVAGPDVRPCRTPVPVPGG